MKRKFLQTGWLNRFVIIFALFWILSILVFSFSFAVATGWFHGTVQSTAFGNSKIYLILTIASIGVGFFSFFLAILLVIAKVAISNKIINLGKGTKGFISFIPKYFLFLATLPLVLLYKNIRGKRELQRKVVGTLLIIVLILPFWVGAYALGATIIASQLGYTTRDLAIVGTGSMYPTWPKGDAGKSPKELGKQIVANAGFLPYPNGIVIAGRRLFGTQIGRNDIVTFRNPATDVLNHKISGEPGGLLKRVIAIGGDTLELRDGLVYLNGTAIKEPYIAKGHSTFGESFLQECQKVSVPQGQVFTMGDNRMGSSDSREIGFVPISDISFVLPFKDQKGNLDKNWHDTTHDLDNSSKLKIDTNEFVNLLNIKRESNGAGQIKYNSKLSNSAELRGKAILKYDDYSYEATISGYPMEKSMADAGYWNPYWWEIVIPGYYDAKSLIEDYLDRDISDAKNVWFDKKFDDIGVAQVEGEVNGCPTQVIVIQTAGYIPASYEPSVLQGWRDAINNLNSIIPSWEGIKGKGWVNENDLSHLLDLFYKEKTIATNILAKEEAKLWLSKEDNASIDQYNTLINESSALAKKLNGS